MGIRTLAVAAIALSGSGCFSQILLDGAPAHDASRIASGVGKQVQIVQSRDCIGIENVRYQVRERVGNRLIRRCARVRGFDYRPGSDYVLQVRELPATPSSGASLVLERVIEQKPASSE